MELTTTLVLAERLPALRFIGSVIHELTVIARAFHDQPGARHALGQVNEAVHSLSGHLRDLCDTGEVLTSSRAQGMVAAAELLAESTLCRILVYSPL